MKHTLISLFALLPLGAAAQAEHPGMLTPPCVVEQGFLYTQAPFPACHATTVCETTDGRIVAAFFGGTYEGHPDCNVWMCAYDADGHSWSAPTAIADGVYTRYTKTAFSYDADFEQIAHRDSLFDKTTWLAPTPHSGRPLISDRVRKPCYNPVLYQLPGGDLVLDYKIGKWVQDWTGWEIRSRNGGRTWTHPEPLQTDTVFHQLQLGPVKNKPVISNGRLIAGSSTETGGRWRFHFETKERATAGTEAWRMIGVDCDTIECIQPSIIFLTHPESQGRLRAPKGAPAPKLKAIGRTRHGRLAQTFSDDNGLSWSRVELSDMPNNNSGTDAVTLRDGRHVLVYNDSRTEGVRTPLSVAVSSDGEHWTKLCDLETDDLGEYSYPCVIEASDGRVWVLYTWRRQRPAYAVIDLSR